MRAARPLRHTAVYRSETRYKEIHLLEASYTHTHTHTHTHKVPLSSGLLEINRMSVTRAFPYSRDTNVLPRIPQWRGKSKQEASFGSKCVQIVFAKLNSQQTHTETLIITYLWSTWWRWQWLRYCVEWWGAWCKIHRKRCGEKWSWPNLQLYISAFNQWDRGKQH